MKEKQFGISLLLSVVTISAMVYINYQIAKEYLRVDAKTKALFGIKEILQFSYQYSVIITGLMAFVIALAINKNNKQKIIAASVSISAVMLAFCRIWRLFT